MALILVIEDDANINGLLCNILKRSGYEVQSSMNGWEGYELAMQNDYGLILMDLMLPMKSGEEILRELRTKVSSCSLPFCVPRQPRLLQCQLFSCFSCAIFFGIS